MRWRGEWSFRTMPIIEINPFQSIYPIFKVKVENEIPCDADYLGTGFFLKLDKWCCLITAKHVIENTKLSENEKFAISEKIENDVKIVPLKGLFGYKVDEDISFMIVKESIDKLKNPVRPLELHRQELKLGQQVCSFGFPLSDKISDQILKINNQLSKVRNLLLINSLFFEGVIQSIVDDEFLKDMVPNCFKKNYYISFPAYRGMSGAPILVGTKEDLKVAGIIYENLQTEFIVESKEIKTSENKKETIINKEIYRFGLSSTYLPLMELEQILNGFDSKRNKPT
jgi:hypothetical protein